MIVCGAFLPLPPAGFGAVERVWLGLARCFAKRGHAVTILSKDVGAADVPEERLERIVVKGARRTGRIGIDLTKDLLYTLRALRRLPPVDVTVTNTFWAPVLLPLLARRCGQVVVHVARSPRGQFGLYRSADRFDAVSESVAEELREGWPRLADRVRVFPNPIDAQVFSPGPDRYSRLDHGPVVYVGRLHPEKGVHLLIEAFALLARGGDRRALRIVGPWRADQGGGGADYAAHLKRLADGLRVEFRDPIAETPALVEELRSCSLFCYPSLAEKGETFGLSVLEAMATGGAALVSDLAPFRSLVHDGVDARIFDHRGSAGVENCARAMKDMLARPRDLQSMGEAARTRALQFDFDAVADQRLRDYADLLDRSCREQRDAG